MVITIIVVVINLATIIVVIIRFDWDQVVTGEISGRGGRTQTAVTENFLS